MSVSTHLHARLVSDHDRLRSLATHSGGVLTLQSTSRDLRHYRLGLQFPLLVERGRPPEIAIEPAHWLRVDLPDQYPELPPRVRLERGVFHPDVCPDGTLCLCGSHWTHARALDELLCAVIEQLQGENLNLLSPCNYEAAHAWADPAFRASLRDRLGPVVRLDPVDHDIGPFVILRCHPGATS